MSRHFKGSATLHFAFAAAPVALSGRSLRAPLLSKGSAAKTRLLRRPHPTKPKSGLSGTPTRAALALSGARFALRFYLRAPQPKPGCSALALRSRYPAARFALTYHSEGLATLSLLLRSGFAARPRIPGAPQEK